jgi:hypothetical protein
MRVMNIEWTWVRQATTFMVGWVVTCASYAQIPDLSQVGNEARRSMEMACNTDRVLNGAAAYARCLDRQLQQYSQGPTIPDLSRYGNEARRSMEMACNTDRVLNGAAAYAKCLSRQTAQYQAGAAIPDLTRYSSEIRRSMEMACNTDRVLNGAAAYARCLDKQIADLRAMENTTGRAQAGTAPRPNPSAIDQEQRNIEAEQRRQEAEKERLLQQRLEIERRRQVAEKEKLEQNARLLAEERKRLEQLAATQPALRRTALVIGNAAYRINPLRNPVNDSTDMARALRESGFEVIEVANATLPQLRTAARQFADKLAASEVALIYFSGHGVEMRGRNYLIPVNADIQREFEVADQAYDATQFVEMMESVRGPNGQRVNILIIDACRNNDLPKSWRAVGAGLARMEAPAGTFIAFATAPGKVAADGTSRNSPFTRHLLTAMRQPNQPIEQVFKSVRRAVMEETAGLQVPWENSSLVGDFYFKVTRP